MDEVISTDDLEQVHIVSYGLTELIKSALEKMQAIQAMMDTMMFLNEDCGEGSWFSITLSALLESLVLSVSTLLDRAKYRTESNCCFRELKYIIETDGETTAKYQKCLTDIDSYLDKYADVVSDKMRNKRLAHRDLAELFNHNSDFINLSLIKQFLIDGYEIVSDVLESAVGGRLLMPDLDAMERKYKDSLRYSEIKDKAFMQRQRDSRKEE